MPASNFGVLASTTLKNYRKTLTDNIFQSSATLFLLKSRQKVEDGGEYIIEPLMSGLNSTAGSYDGYDVLDTTPQEGIDAAQYSWKQESVSITISGREERINKGKSRVINLLEGKINQAEMSLTEKVNEHIHTDGTGNSSKDITGLKAMVESTGTYAGIARATYTFWKADTTGSSTAMTLALLREKYNLVSKGGKETPNLILSASGHYEDYEELMAGKSTFEMVQNRAQKLIGDAGFDALRFKGAAWTWDEQAPTDRTYFLNTKFMGLTVHRDANWSTTPFQKPINQDAKVAQILWMGNLTASACKRLGYRLFS